MPGDLILNLFIVDGDNEQDAGRWLNQAFGYWHELFMREDLVSVQSRLPDKLINPQP